MIQLFRRIRRNLLSENRFSKYLLYAVGEILLVVIGILIAIQINNLNEQSKRNDLEMNLLKEMKDNLLTDLEDIRFNIAADSAAMYSNQLVLHQVSNNLPYHDSLSVHYGRLPQASTLVENISAYENLKTFGMNLISNDSLRRRVTNLYSARYQYIDEILDRTSNKYLWEQFNPVLLRNLKANIVLADSRPVDPEALLDNHVFEEHLKWNVTIRGFIIQIYRDTENEIVEIVNLIDAELENS